MNKNIVWHYSAVVKLPLIVVSGVLKGSNTGAESELPMLWFSANQQWENTATKMIETKSGSIVRLTFNQQAERFGCIRFGLASCDSRLLNWRDACKAAGTPREMRKAMEKSGKKSGGDPMQWFATASIIPLSELHFQVWMGKEGWCDATSPQDVVDAWVSHCTKRSQKGKIAKRANYPVGSFCLPHGASLIRGAGKRGLMARYALIGVAMP